MSYEPKDFTGALFQNKKQHDRQPSPNGALPGVASAAAGSGFDWRE